MQNKQVCVIGGTGFVGGHLINALSAAGYECRVPTRNPERHRDLRLVPGCRVHRIDDWGAASLEGAMAGCGTLVYLVGILNELGGAPSSSPTSHWLRPRGPRQQRAGSPAGSI